MISDARKRRILGHLAQSRRARESSRFDDKAAAAQARIQRRLSAQRQEVARIQASGLEAAHMDEADVNARIGSADAQGILRRSEATEDANSVQALRDSMARLRKLDRSGSRFIAPVPDAAAQAAAGPRRVGVQEPATAFTNPEQGEIARLQVMAKSEKERADFVAALLQDVLSASTARIMKHQARLEAMQAQINSLQGR